MKKDNSFLTFSTARKSKDFAQVFRAHPSVFYAFASTLPAHAADTFERRNAKGEVASRKIAVSIAHLTAHRDELPRKGESGRLREAITGAIGVIRDAAGLAGGAPPACVVLTSSASGNFGLSGKASDFRPGMAQPKERHAPRVLDWNHFRDDSAINGQDATADATAQA